MPDYMVPKLNDVMLARKVLRRYFPPSPLVNFPALDSELGAQTYLKLENMLPTGSFKVRGATYLISKLSAEERRKGVIAASTGNFSQGVSYASRLFGTHAMVVMPEGSNPEKVQATRSLGGEIIFHGPRFDDARIYAESLSREEGYRYIHSANEPDLVAGVGTLTLEVLEEVPDIDAIIVPVGGGSGASGASIVAKAVNSGIEVIGVQSESSPAAFLSWKEGRIVEAENRTYAEGLSTAEGYEFTQKIMRRHLDEFTLVSDNDIKVSMRLVAEKAHIIPESASSSSIAAALKMKEKIKGKKIALIITGGNSPDEQVRELFK
ncbi:hypothetical protein IX51_04680 [uncultured archaeon]|nr:hypothetical protein IX51_04680 [uncultured archaeon]